MSITGLWEMYIDLLYDWRIDHVKCGLMFWGSMSNSCCPRKHGANTPALRCWWNLTRFAHQVVQPSSEIGNRDQSHSNIGLMTASRINAPEEWSQDNLWLWRADHWLSDQYLVYNHDSSAAIVFWASRDFPLKSCCGFKKESSAWKMQKLPWTKGGPTEKTHKASGVCHRLMAFVQVSHHQASKDSYTNQSRRTLAEVAFTLPDQPTMCLDLY